jgi:leucine dehydrogenase
MTQTTPPARALDLAQRLGHEAVHYVHDRASGLRAVIAIHDTTLGPAIGGTRMRLYPSLDEAAIDALRLARGMTYKAAMAGMRCGGGKAVILGDPGRDKTPALLEAYARVVEGLDGRFYTGCDMGVSVDDLVFMRAFTRHLGHTGAEGGLDTSDLAAMGTFSSIEAVARFLSLPLAGLHVVVQGLGQVGLRLARQLAAAGVRLTVTDVDAGRTQAAVKELGATAVAPEGPYDVPADVFSPNAGGSVLSAATIPRLRCRAVVGAANEQLATPADGEALHARGVLYAPDYVVNAGGLLSVLWERGETDVNGVVARTRQIGHTLTSVLERARATGRPPNQVADELVEQRLLAARVGRDPGRVG